MTSHKQLITYCYLSTAKVLIVFFFFQSIQLSHCQKSLGYYLPEINYNDNISTPEAFLGYQIGEWHITHDQLYYYVKKICAESPRCKCTEYARSHEDKPLVYLSISSVQNMGNLDSLKAQHYRLTNPEDTIDLEETEIPLVLYQGYSVHGNESSGANAAALLAYYLLAGESQQIDRLLQETIILLDPCYNPDGLQRFSTWANSHKSENLNPDPTDREFNEEWPGGRTNHYWFDLNRDWLFNIHPSSKGRMQVFHEWKPDILTDHHEMGSNSTFFFQPGIPSRTNPNTPQINQNLTEQIGEFHAMFLDSIGSEYFSKERYDDFYYGKGSTYPDINGAIGILFEQASSRGHLRQTRNGLLSFPFTIRNQMVTSLSTQKAALALKGEILKYKYDFFRDRYNSEISEGCYLYMAEDDYKARFFFDMLQRHEIDVYQPTKDTMFSGIEFKKQNTFVVPKKQKQTTLIKTIFETVHDFRDSLFYDVSAWTVPMALNIEYAESDVPYPTSHMKLIEDYPSQDKSSDIINEDAMAVAFSWDSYMAPSLLQNLQDKGVKVKVLTEDSYYISEGVLEDFKKGTLIISFKNQDLDKQEISDILINASSKFNIPFRNIDSSYSARGISLGSNKLIELEPIRVAMVVGDGINAYEAGATWYQMDKRLGMKLTKIDIHDLAFKNLTKYDLIILPDGKYGALSNESAQLRTWLRNGGTLICMRRAIDFAENQGLIGDLKRVESDDLIQNDETSYNNYSTSRGAQIIGGSIFETEISLDHPLFYGYKRNKLPVFKRGTQFYQLEKLSATPMRYSQTPVLSGYSSDQNIKKAKGAAALICAAYGNGTVIACVDNPNFRAYWLGGSKLFANMLFMSPLISRETMLR